jgi:hypothetical protein
MEIGLQELSIVFPFLRVNALGIACFECLFDAPIFSSVKAHLENANDFFGIFVTSSIILDE